MAAEDERRVAVVTGGARGIGAEVCRRLARVGHAVAVFDVLTEDANDVVGELEEAAAFEVDVTEAQSVRAGVDAVLERWDRVDVLVNNAGWDSVQPFLENEPELWDRLIAVNLLGPIRVSHAVLPSMVAQGSGRVVNVASDAGRVGSSGESVYAACKGGVIALSKSLAREMARHGITVNCICPGPTETPLMAELRADETGERIMDAIVKATPLRRLADPADVAEAAAFFASPAAGFITGQVLSVSGGLTMSG